ncbi:MULTISPECIES: MFS transporter [Paenarthrobacter]|jgi:MFS family permease|uniref:MFS transporter n=1 Tax=Paenarthrobacter ureafaciens TaxID=37931 RepID=A0AAX3EDG0_PAEUR|nr:MULTISPECIES: MFS transporter [Paenarthrobacter]MDO5865040.1 MFS transporter [Paenarthrobacter sp. SD-2]MDO5876117.1 MFS transporter [Paenarthrobacter sp. SD-1]QMU82861.1 MFS transporter [Paenarthrobacter ureafaciens]UYV91391.1 MFS transporter [Paenarthrobacter ureafaciens]UYV95911.1 MFS transporter [Paenarthrobacter ureafaciens]
MAESTPQTGGTDPEQISNRAGDPVQEPDTDRTWLNKGIIGVGSASFFSDSGHELVTSLLPSFLTSTLHAGPAALGAIEGVSDALVGLSKLAGGPLSNEPSRRAKIASGGYLLTAVATALIGICTMVWQVGILRGIAWASRGVRSPARDTLLVSITPRAAYGRAAGLERAGDNAGAIAGPLLAGTLVGLIGIREAILLSFIPSIFAAVAITIAARHARNILSTPTGRQKLSFNLGELRRSGVAKALIPVSFFELGNLATTLLILRATELLTTEGREPAAAASLAIFFYAAHNGAATIASLAGGHLADHAGPRPVFAAGGTAYLGAYLLFGFGPPGWAPVLAGFLLAGIGIGFAETAEATTVALSLPDRLRGNGYGILGLIQSAGDLGATVTAGILWAAFSPTVAFTYAAAWMLASVISSSALHTRPAND